MCFHKPHFFIFIIAQGVQEVNDFPKITQLYMKVLDLPDHKGVHLPFKAADVTISWV